MKIKWIWFMWIGMVILLCAGCRSGGYPRSSIEIIPIQNGEYERDASRRETEGAAFQGAESRVETSVSTKEEKDSSDESKELSQQVEELIQSMTLEEKAAQLFIVLPESLMKVECVTAAGETTKEAINQIPVGGFVYMSKNLISSNQVRTMLSNVQEYSIARLGVPAFLSLDEEGGSVTRISRTGKFDVPDIGHMAEIGETRDIERARQIGDSIGAYLADLGFNVDFAPVADVLSNPDNMVVKSRSFGSEPQLVAEMSLSMAAGLKDHGIISTFKHFPGHGATTGDTHAGYAYTEKTLEQLLQCELVPFQKAISRNAGIIMVGHISLPNITGDNAPASLSPAIIQDLLRGQLGYDGIVVTDAMNMGAIAKQYSSAEAAVKALSAGADIILMPVDFQEAYRGVVDAVNGGRLSSQRIDQSLRRILTIKFQMKH